MNNAEKIALKIFCNGRNTTEGSDVSKHLIRKGTDSIECHTKKTLQELKDRVKRMDEGTKLSELVFKEDVITLIDEAINE